MVELRRSLPDLRAFAEAVASLFCPPPASEVCSRAEQALSAALAEQGARLMAVAAAAAEAAEVQPGAAAGAMPSAAQWALPPPLAGHLQSMLNNRDHAFVALWGRSCASPHPHFLMSLEQWRAVKAW